METIRPGKRYIKKQLIIGYFFIIFGVVSLLFTGRPYLSAIGIIFLVTGYSQKNKNIIKIYEDHMEVKLSFLSSLQYIKFENINKVEDVNAKKIIIHHTINSRSKRFVIHLSIIEKSDFEKFIQILRERLSDIVNNN